jgi:hypothetical protein
MFPIYSERQIPEFTWQAKEVVREVDHRPHLLVRISVSGGHFPQRAMVPVMGITHDGKLVARSWFTEISADEQTLYGYFATDLPGEGVIEFGYAGQPLGRVRARFDGKEIRRLVRERLGREITIVTRATLEKLRHS